MVENINEKLKEGLTLYLGEWEDNSDDYYDNYLNINIALSREGQDCRWRELESITLSSAEIRELIWRLADLNKDVVKRRLFSKFGYKELESFPGYPKGPIYSIDDEVYEAILRPDLKVIK